MAELPGQYGIKLSGRNIRKNLELARYADRKGIDSIWVVEGRLTVDAISPMAIYATATDRVRVGSAVIPMWTRNPALIAQTFATLDIVAPGRIVMGLGAWWDPLASRTGVVRRKPVRAMREVVGSVRLLLSMKEKVTYHGEYVHMEDLYLDHGETQPHEVEIYLAAVGPQMLRLAGRIADGVILNANHTVEAIRRAVGEVRKGAESIGRTLSEIERVEPIPIQVTRNKKEAIQRAKPEVAQKIAQQPHIEGPSEVDPELARQVKALIPWPGTERQYLEGAKLISDELVESLGCYGDEDEVQARLGEYRAAGVTTPVANNPSRETIDYLARGY